MQAYIAKRILLIIPTAILVTIFVFFILRIVPGDPAMILLSGEGQDPEEYSEEDLQALRKELGVDRNIAVQYGDWFGDMFRLDFGDSWFYDRPVATDLKKRLPITLELTIFAVLLASVVAVPLGVFAAIKQDSVGDYVSRIITIWGIALPNFWVAIMLIFFLVLWFDYLPPLGYVDLWINPWTNLQQLFWPAIALGIGNMAFIARVTRSAMLEVLREDYIRTARSKGLAEHIVVSRHALKNALLPVVTVSGYEFGRLLAGTAIIETIFVIPGMGRLLITSIFHKDFPQTQAIVVVMVVMVLVLNMILDVAYAWLNPRIRYT